MAKEPKSLPFGDFFFYTAMTFSFAELVVISALVPLYGIQLLTIVDREPKLNRWSRAATKALLLWLCSNGWGSWYWGVAALSVIQGRRSCSPPKDIQSDQLGIFLEQFPFRDFLLNIPVCNLGYQNCTIMQPPILVQVTSPGKCRVSYSCNAHLR